MRASQTYYAELRLNNGQSVLDTLMFQISKLLEARANEGKSVMNTMPGVFILVSCSWLTYDPLLEPPSQAPLSAG